MEWVRLIDEAEFLIGGKKIPNELTKAITTCAALAVESEMEVSPDEGTEQLRGVFSCLSRELDWERHDRTYFDLDVDMKWAAEMLKARIYDGDVFGSPDSGEEGARKNSPVGGTPTQSKRLWQFRRKTR